MLLNFHIWKVRWLKPFLCCLKKTGPSDSSLMAMAMAAMTGLRTRRRRAAPRRSKASFRSLPQSRMGGVETVTSGRAAPPR
jgi:hypothetical protein